MGCMGIIFDLDQTLINSLPALELKRQRRWADVYPLIPILRPSMVLMKY